MTTRKYKLDDTFVAASTVATVEALQAMVPGEPIEQEELHQKIGNRVMEAYDLFNEENKEADLLRGWFVSSMKNEAFMKIFDEQFVALNDQLYSDPSFTLNMLKLGAIQLISSE